MGTAIGTNLNDSNNIINEVLTNKDLKEFEFEENNHILRSDAFITIIVTAKESIDPNFLDVSPGTPLVFKIFPRQNDNYLRYSQEFENIRLQYSNLQTTPNILPILKLKDIQESNVGVSIRQYIKYNLTDALYYMSCVSEIEKKWICFQLLHGLNQIHSRYKCHGDIKPDNILISSKLSAFLSDISVYKPVYLAIEDLQSYNNFFYSNPNDINNPCYLAPERFVNNISEIQKNKNELTPEMDIFSLGVVMSEIFLDKFGLFTQLDMINYKNKKINLKDKLGDIKDINIKLTLENMLELDPQKRNKLSHIINNFGEILCPAPITKFIVRLNLMIIAYEYYKNDLLVALLYKHFQQIWKCLCINNKNLKELGKNIPKLKKKLNKNIIIFLLTNKYNIYNIGNEFPLAFISNNKKEIFIESDINEDFLVENLNVFFDNNNDCTILIIKYLLSCLDNNKYISTYLVVFEMIFNLSKILIKNNNSDIILEYIIPHYINLFKSGSSRLKIEAYNSMIDVLSLINYEELILNQINYNYFNNYIFDNLHNLFFKCNQIEVKCAIISRIDEIIELENNFLLSYLNSINYITKEKQNEKNILSKSLYYSILLHQSYNITEHNNEHNKNNTNLKFSDIYKAYSEDLNSFKKKLKEIIENIMNDKENDYLKLIAIQKYKEICMFLGKYNENITLFSHFFVFFNGNDYFIQKEIIRNFPNLILLYGRKLFKEYFLTIIEGVCQRKNSELMIIEIIDSIFLLTKMNLISHDDDYSKIYKILIPYFAHPNYTLRIKLFNLFSYILSDERNFKCKLYISFYHNIKNILVNSKLNENEEKAITIINSIDKEKIKSLKEYYTVPREIFLLYKYNIKSSLINNNYLNLLGKITKVKKNHFENIIKNNNLQRNLGYLTKNDIENIIEKKIYDIILKELNKILKYSGNNEEKNSAFVQSSFINKLTILLYELNFSKKNFLEKWYDICSNKNNIYYSRILYLLKVLNYKLDPKNITTANLMQTNDDNFIYNSSYRDFMLIKKSKIKSMNFKMENRYNLIDDAEKKAKFCYKLLLNESESIIKLIAINSLIVKNYLNMFISISDEGIIRLHMIYKESNFEDIYTIKNISNYHIDIDNCILKKNNISYIEQNNRIIVIVAIKKKIQLVNFELNNGQNNKENMNNLEQSYIVNILECKSDKEIISIENIYNNKKSYLALGNNDNSISFYNYLENQIDYLNNSISFSASYGNIEFIITLFSSTSNNNILLTTSNGFIILYDYSLRLFTHAYSIKKKIRQILEYIPSNASDLIFEHVENEKLDNQKGSIFLLTDDNEITLWNLSLLKPIIIYQFIELEKIEDYKNKEYKYEIPEITKLSLEKNAQNNEYLNLFDNEFSLLIKNKQENKIIRMNIPFNYQEECSFPLMLIGEKCGNCRILQFSPDNLNKIRNKQDNKSNKFGNIVICNENMKIESRNKFKFKKRFGAYINKTFFTVNNLNEKQNNINDDFLLKEMNDILFMKDYYKNINYIISCYSNGEIKLWTL